MKLTLEEELAKFKAIVRHIARHEANHQKGDRFKVESRNKLGKLADLGIGAHQPAVAAYCKVSDKERETFIGSLLTQKVGSNHKNMKIFKVMLKTNEEIEEALQHDGDPEVSDDRTPNLPDRGQGMLSERTSEISLAGDAHDGMPSVAGRVDRFEDDARKARPRGVDSSTTPSAAILGLPSPGPCGNGHAAKENPHQVCQDCNGAHGKIEKKQATTSTR